MSDKNDLAIGDLIRERVISLCDVFGKRCGDGLPGAVTEHLKGFPVSVLRRAFRRAECELEKFPTIKKLRELCHEETPSQMWTRTFRSAVGKDTETGRLVNILVDPQSGEEMFYPADCPEGRKFLKLLHTMAGRHELAQEKTETELEIERQTQQLALAQITEKK